MTPLARLSLTRATFSSSEEADLRRTWRAHARASCPCCGVPLEARPVPTPKEVSYVRSRSWLTCPRCGRTVVVDDRRGAS